MYGFVWALVSSKFRDCFFQVFFFEWNAVVVSFLFQILEIAFTVLSISLFNYYF